MTNHEITREDEQYSPILVPIPDSYKEGWMHDTSRIILELIIRAYRCRNCPVFKNSQIPSDRASDPPHIRSYYQKPDDSSLLQINFACPSSSSAFYRDRKFSCHHPHTITIKENNK